MDGATAPPDGPEDSYGASPSVAVRDFAFERPPSQLLEESPSRDTSIREREPVLLSTLTRRSRRRWKMRGLCCLVIVVLILLGWLVIWTGYYGILKKECKKAHGRFECASSWPDCVCYHDS